jgi:heme A synthase
MQQAGKHERVAEPVARRRDNQVMSRLATHLAVAVLLAVAVGGTVAVALMPGNTASRVAVGLGVVAAIIAAGNFASNPDWDEMAGDLRRIREIADRRPSTPVQSQPRESDQRNGSRWLRGLLVGVLIAQICRGVLPKLRKRHL